MQSPIPPELIQKHYILMTASMMEHSVRAGIPLEKVIARTVQMFGLVPTANDPLRYELIPELRKEADAVTQAHGAPTLPATFSEDEAVLFCACQTASLQQAGKLGEVAQKLKGEVARLKAEGSLKEETPATEGADKTPTNVVPLRKGGFGSDGGNGPTFH